MKKEDEIPIGTRVTLNPKSYYADPSDNRYSSNPVGIEGTIDYYKDSEYSVKWDNGKIGICYKIGEDLIILGENLNQEFYY